MIANDKQRHCGLGMSRESKFLSLVLRQKPEEIGLQLDKHGWVRVDDLPRKLKRANRKLSRGELFQLVESSDKKAFHSV
ncbi:RNA 2'-phosphotransferase [uncultured Tateyamaria sp.]|uniref:RNA 2'-phosphotransferase n=1 Tax=uncultured Tateyamaria sp. TaxID=455651 RepID=UPI002623FAD7|nr:RNA 2'-phosphotransferase [uncultured Tateyamaria sp.]